MSSRAQKSPPAPRLPLPRPSRPAAVHGPLQVNVALTPEQRARLDREVERRRASIAVENPGVTPVSPTEVVRSLMLERLAQCERGQETIEEFDRNREGL